MRRASFLLLFALLATTLATGAPEGETIPVDVQALRDVRVPAEVSGRVLKRPDDESATVQAGQVVVTIDPVFLRAGARAARASATRARARHEWAQIELKRVLDLFDRGSIVESEVDQTRVAAREAEATFAAAEAQAAEVDTRLSRARIVAPFAGKLVRIYPQIGEYLRIGETAFRIIDDSQLKLVLYVPARLLARMRVGNEVRVRSDIKGARLPELLGKVFSIAPAAEGKARTFRVEVRAKDKTGTWRPGMTGRLTLPASTR